MLGYEIRMETVLRWQLLVETGWQLVVETGHPPEGTE
jgi:hypothetical protein